MAKCKQCSVEMGFADKLNAKSYQGLCRQCTEANRQQAAQIASGVPPEKLAAQEERNAAIERILLTTETFPQDLQILERVEIVTAECAFGMNIFKDLFAGVRDIVGGRSEAVQKTMRDSRRTVLYELKREAYEVGANAVIGVDLDYVELSAAGSMVMLVASGTAVKVAER